MRVFLIVLDSFGVGNAPDAAAFGDEGSNTFKACFDSGKLNIPNMKKLGLFNIDGVDFGEREKEPLGAYARLVEESAGKDTTIGHWEIAGIISEKPLPVFPDGFPDEVIKEFERRTGRKTLCNKPYSGTEVIKDYGVEHMKTGALIVYTSADSVFQVAANENVVPVKKLYEYCEIARDILKGDYAVGRVIARPFVGTSPENFARTSNRHDFSLLPPSKTMLDILKDNGKDVLSVGKIIDIFAGQGITEFVRTVSNADGMVKTAEFQKKDFDGLCFVNLVDFDMKYGHRNDVAGYTNALNEFDIALGDFMKNMREDDVLMLTADHGCDPSTPSTDHSRECVPLIICGNNVKSVNLGTRKGFTCIAKTILSMFNLKNTFFGEDLAPEIKY
ncbi:MAG: phosphopentomutase [Clostridia bacterium]|nr:phosphopentomutase [Clostridia bacterium]